jgi:hypothetical protein
MTTGEKSEAERIDQRVADGLRMIGLSSHGDYPALPSIPREAKPTETPPAFKVTIGNASR